MDGTYTVGETVREHDKTIVVNQLRGFVAALYKFFCESSPCDWKSVYVELNIFQSKIDGLRKKIADHQHEMIMDDDSPWKQDFGATSDFRNAAESRSRSRSAGWGATFSRPASPSVNSRSAKSKASRSASRPKSATNYMLSESQDAGRPFQVHQVHHSAKAGEEIEDLIGAVGNLRRWRNRPGSRGLLDLS